LPVEVGISPLRQSILPSSQAFAATARVLKNRAAHSHLSVLTESIPPFLREISLRLKHPAALRHRHAARHSRLTSARNQFSRPESRLTLPESHMPFIFHHIVILSEAQRSRKDLVFVFARCLDKNRLYSSVTAK
jgi:hypothetical protein